MVDIILVQCKNLLTGLIGILDDPDLMVGHGAEDLDKGILVRAHPHDGIVQLLRIVLGQRGHQRHNHILKLSRALTLQIFNQVLPEKTMKWH